MPVFSNAIISPSAAHRGHHARVEFPRRRMSKELVSIVIFVCFAMRLFFVKRSRH
jgi:hypothetical protein